VKYFFFLSWIAMSAFANAKVDFEKLKAILESQPNCQNFVRYDDKNIYLGFGYYKNGVEEPHCILSTQPLM